jgi:hypothetical protein
VSAKRARGNHSRHLLVRAAAPAIVALACACALAQAPLPPLHDGSVVAGPGEFRTDGELAIRGKIVLRNLTLHLHGPVRVAAGATLDIENVHLLVADPEGAPNGTNGLNCDGPAHIIVHNSTMAPVGTAHPMWGIQGTVEVDGFDTENSEFHLDHAQARLNRLDIFELEISHQSIVTARDLKLVFLSNHTGDNDQLHFDNIPADRPFTRALTLGSGARADLTNVQVQFFLLYVHGSSSATLAHMGRVQLALWPECEGRLRLPKGRLGTAAALAVFPQPNTSTCPFRLTLNDVNVDTWDVYATGEARLTFTESQIDELVASAHSNVTVRNSTVFADWLGVANDASMSIEDSTVGALSRAAERPDLATSQVRVSGHGHATFSRVRFDCGIVAQDDAIVDIVQPIKGPAYMRRSGRAVIRTGTQSAAR